MSEVTAEVAAAICQVELQGRSAMLEGKVTIHLSQKFACNVKTKRNLIGRTLDVRSCKTQSRALIVVLVIACVWSAVSFSAVADNNLQKYQDIWSAARSQAVSGKIQYHIYASADAFQLRNRRAVLEQFAKLKQQYAQNFAGLLREFAYTLAGQQMPKNAPDYPILTFYFDGLQNRTDRYGRTEIFNGELTVDSFEARVGSGTSQITIGEAPQEMQHWRQSILDFCYIPSPDLAATMYVDSSGSDVDVLKIKPSQQQVEPFAITVAKNGDVLRVESQSGSAGTKSERIQDGFTTFDGGVRLPRIVFDAKYGADQLISARLTVIREAAFNLQMDPSLFVQKGKRGDILVDNRTSKRSIRTLVNDANDVTKVRFATASGPVRQPFVAQNSSRRNLLIVLNILVVVAIAAALLYRKLRSSRLQSQ